MQEIHFPASLQAGAEQIDSANIMLILKPQEKYYLWFSRETESTGCLYKKEEEIYYKEFDHVIMETEKSQDLHLPVGDPRERMLYCRPENRESQWHKFQSEDWQAPDPRRADVSVWVQRQENTGAPSPQSDRRNSLLLGEGQPLCSKKTFNLVGRGPPILGRAVCFTQYNSNVNNHPETILQTHSE